jgi:hypothetical protein
MMLSAILDHIDSRPMPLPEVQRGTTWKGDQVCGLFDSVQRLHDWKRNAP